MRNLRNLCEQLCSGRKATNPAGKKLASYVYVLRNLERGCYELREVVRTWGDKGRLKPEDWETKHFADVFPTYTKLFYQLPSSMTRKVFGIEHYKARSIKIAGRDWSYKDKIFTGTAPLTIDDRGIQFDGPPLVRTFNKERRAEILKLFKDLKFHIGVRHKLGAFDQVDMETLLRATRDQYGYYWRIMGNPKKLEQILRQVNPEDITTFYPLMVLSLRGSYYRRTGPVDWLRELESFLKNARETIYRATEVVTYEEAQ